MPPTPESAARSRGVVAAGLSYLVWGLVPLFWKQLAGIDALELIAHRHVWSLLFVAVLLAAQRRLGEVGAALRGVRSIATHVVSALLLTGNWLVYVWGVNTGHVVEASLGYFLVPLVNVACGRLVLGEHLRRAQWLAIACAAAGVVWLVVQVGRPPWIAFGLAATWGGYGLMRKQSRLGAVTGLTVETLLLAPFALAFLWWRQHTGVGALGRVPPREELLVLSAGVVTAVPLVMFSYSARRIRLSTLGLLQYITPTVQLLLGVCFYGEPFPRARMIGFACIWTGLALYTTDSLIAQRKFAAAV